MFELFRLTNSNANVNRNPLQRLTKCVNSANMCNSVDVYGEALLVCRVARFCFIQYTRMV
jgi:hypothetical protein